VNYEGLDKLSYQFARELFSAFPAWKHFAKNVKGADGIASVQVDVVQDGTDRVLHLSTAGGKVTIGFDEWHTHVGPFLGIDVEESVKTAIGIIKVLSPKRP
jgi:hypothetical protein